MHAGRLTAILLLVGVALLVTSASGDIGRAIPLRLAEAAALQDFCGAARQRPPN